MLSVGVQYIRQLLIKLKLPLNVLIWSKISVKWTIKPSKAHVSHLLICRLEFPHLTCKLLSPTQPPPHSALDLDHGLLVEAETNKSQIKTAARSILCIESSPLRWSRGLISMPLDASGTYNWKDFLGGVGLEHTEGLHIPYGLEIP